ncbi:hypothetical protein [Priestia koreensis]|uniref:hypothetical protein n=1 Tax=Priestia koreensis TaxID=284581 RepID=UPI002040AC37|nr:hypothetical protein [Priestia koreensis]MCM3002917.1 hypothetical protein [Priestia koreensis]
MKTNDLLKKRLALEEEQLTIEKTLAEYLTVKTEMAKLGKDAYLKKYGSNPMCFAPFLSELIMVDVRSRCKKLQSEIHRLDNENKGINYVFKDQLVRYKNRSAGM